MLANRADDDESGIVAEINVTPLTDIFLVLLIIFMVTTTAFVERGSTVSLPRSNDGPTGAHGVVVTAAVDRPLEVNGSPVTLETLADALRAQFQRGAEHSVVLRGDRSLALEQAVQIMNVAKAAGADKIAIATAPAPAPALR